jgi:hydrogenase expression/formation protein HypE
LPTSGKESQDFMDTVVYAHLGLPSQKMIVGPGRGLDNAVVKLGHGRVLIVTVDPVSVIPSLGMRLSAWLSVHLIASDLTASGVDPEFATFSYNFPPEMKGAQREAYLRSVGAECRRLGVAIIGGNTGTYPGGGYTVIGAGSMFGVASEESFVTPAMARVGDRVLMTKHAAIEAAASLANAFPRFVASHAGEGAARRARNLARACTTVADARAARKVGLGREGVTSMHDATEGGVLGALDEMAFASRKRIVVDPTRIPVPGDVALVCASFQLDPLRTMSEGALLITCAPERVPEVRRVMSRAQVPVAEIGRVERGEGLVLGHGTERPVRYTLSPDGYWGAYEQAINARLR